MGWDTDDNETMLDDAKGCEADALELGKHHPRAHTDDCGYQVDQYWFECTCGVFADKIAARKQL